MTAREQLEALRASAEEELAEVNAELDRATGRAADLRAEVHAFELALSRCSAPSAGPGLSSEAGEPDAHVDGGSGPTVSGSDTSDDEQGHVHAIVRPPATTRTDALVTLLTRYGQCDRGQLIALLATDFGRQNEDPNCVSTTLNYLSHKGLVVREGRLWMLRRPGESAGSVTRV